MIFFNPWGKNRTEPGGTVGRVNQHHAIGKKANNKPLTGNMGPIWGIWGFSVGYRKNREQEEIRKKKGKFNAE